MSQRARSLQNLTDALGRLGAGGNLNFGRFVDPSTFMGFDERALYRMYYEAMAEAERKRLEALEQQANDANTDDTTTDTTTTDTTTTDTTTDDTTTDTTNTTTDDKTTTFDPQDLNQDGEISDQEAAVNLEVWETLQQDLENAERAGVDTGLSTIGILGSIFGADFDVASLNTDLVNILLGVFDKNYDDFNACDIGPGNCMIDQWVRKNS